VGRYLVVLFSDATTGGYFYSEINSITGVPSSTWTKVTTGFVSSKQPNDMWVNNAREVWFAGAGGYIYRSTSITTGVSVLDAGNAVATDLQRIHGSDELIVAVGDGGKVVVSLNRGETFATTTADPTANGLQAVSVVGNYLWWTADDNGGIFYSQDQGASWTTASFPSTVNEVFDILFVTPEVGYISTATSDPTATLYATMDGGYSWTTTDPRILNFPVFDNGLRLAAPNVSNTNTVVNNLAIAGLAGDGSDGIILVGKASAI